MKALKSFFVSFKSRNEPDGSVILIFRYIDETEQETVIEYQS